MILKTLKISTISLLFFTALLGILYPLLMFGIGQLCFHTKANGSLLTHNDHLVGSTNIGQTFCKPQYFHPRPSSAGTGYDATASSGSNLGPTSQKLADAIKQRSKAYRTLNKLSPTTPIPADAVMASASGLDPHITRKNALLQARRVAQARHMSEEDLKKIIENHTEGGLFTEHRINVLKLNLALDK